MTWIIPIIFGSLLDIFGVLLIAQQFTVLHSIGTRVKIAIIEYQELIDKHKLNAYVNPRTNPTEAWNHIYRHIQRVDTQWGLVFLTCGFLLIIIGNIMNYYNIAVN